MKDFQESDVQDNGAGLPKIYADRADLAYDPPKWLAKGLQETASGYGNRLNSGYKISFCGRLYRVYVTCWSNVGTHWFKTRGRTIYVS